MVGRFRFTVGAVSVESGGGRRVRVPGLEGRLELWKVNLMAIVGRRIFIGLDCRVLQFNHLPDFACDDYRPDAHFEVPGIINCLKRVVVDSMDALLVCHETGSMLYFPEIARSIPFISGESTWGGAVGETGGGPILVTSSNDHLIRVHYLRDGTVITISGHAHNIPHVEVSPDGRYILSCGIDKTVRIWGVNGDRVAHYDGATSWVWSGHFVSVGDLARHDRNEVRAWRRSRDGDEEREGIVGLEEAIAEGALFDVAPDERLIEDVIDEYIDEMGGIDEMDDMEYGGDGDIDGADDAALDHIESVSLESLQIWPSSDYQDTWRISSASEVSSDSMADSGEDSISMYRIPGLNDGEDDDEDSPAPKVLPDYYILAITSTDVTVFGLADGEAEVLQHRPRLLYTASHPSQRALFNNPALEWQLHRFHHSLWLPSIGAVVAVNQIGLLAVCHLHRDCDGAVQMEASVVPFVDDPDIEPILGIDVVWLDQTAALLFILLYSGSIEEVIIRRQVY